MISTTESRISIKFDTITRPRASKVPFFFAKLPVGMMRRSLYGQNDSEKQLTFHPRTNRSKNKQLLPEESHDLYEDFLKREARRRMLKEHVELEQSIKSKASKSNPNANSLALRKRKKEIEEAVGMVEDNGYISYAGLQTLFRILGVCIYTAGEEGEELESYRNRKVSPNSARKNPNSDVQEAREKKEEEFMLQLWNLINRHLFNYVETSILIDILLFLFTEDEHTALQVNS